MLDELSDLVQELEKAINNLASALGSHVEGSTLDHAKHARDHIVPAMAKAREVVDKLECVVSDEFWPLPTYQEMLFIK